MTSGAPAPGAPAPAAPLPGDHGHGLVGRVTAVVYRVLVVELLFAVAVAPTVVLLLLLAPGPANVALAAPCAVFVGPALSAALFALGGRARDEGLQPGAAFLRGYRLNALDVLRLWVPALAVLAVLGWTVVNIGAAGVPAWYAWLLIGIGGLVVLWLVHATVVASFFSFRARDTARLAAFLGGRRPRASLAVASAVVLAAALVGLTSVPVLVLVGAPWAAFVLRAERPLLAEVRRRFVA